MPGSDSPSEPGSAPGAGNFCSWVSLVFLRVTNTVADDTIFLFLEKGRKKSICNATDWAIRASKYHMGHRYAPAINEDMRMRGIVILSLLTASLVYGAANGYVEVRDMRLPAEGLTALKVDAGAGSLEVTGVADSNEVVVIARIVVPAKDDAAARRIIASDMVLNLENEGELAVLASHFESSLWSWHDSPAIDLEISVPERFMIVKHDGSGSIKFAGIQGRVETPD